MRLAGSLNLCDAVAFVLLLPLAAQASRVAVDRSFFVSASAATSPTQAAPATTRSVEPNPDCGTWHSSYKKMHESMLRGDIPSKYAIASGASGLADMLTGAVSVFYYALLTDRAFLMHYETKPWAPDVTPQLEWAYSQPSINWTIPSDLRAQLQDLAWSMKGHTSLDDKNSVMYTRLTSGHKELEQVHGIWQGGDTTQYGSNYTTVHVLCQRGMTMDMFANPHLKPKLEALGVKREAAFSCALDFLIDLLPPVRQKVDHIYQALQPVTPAGGSVLRVGIQVRTGDANMKSETTTGEQLLKQYEAFFNCAQQITDTRGATYSRVVWFLVTDSAKLRRAAASKYPDRVVTDLRTAPAHIADENYRANASVQAAVQSSIAENWLLHLADVHVITFESGFGRTAAMWNRRTNDTVYTIHCCWTMAMPPLRKCGANDFDNFDVVVSGWSRI